MKVFIITKAFDGTYEAVIQKLNEFEIEQASSVEDCDAVITIGGDGTILKAGKEAAKLMKPLLGINTGRLGFMATLEKDGLEKLVRLKTKEYAISRRMLLDVEIGGMNSGKFSALNDVVLHRETASRLPDFTVVVRENVEVMRVRADGMIVSTPTGSTAYSLSAGGPMIEPELECFLVTALNPHSLFNRPMIFSPYSHNGEQCTKLSVYAKDVFVSVDGNEGILLKENASVTITKSQYKLDLIDIDGNSFYNSIHNKLMKPLK